MGGFRLFKMVLVAKNSKIFLFQKMDLNYSWGDQFL